jgi:site-specific recombinase XerD
MARLPALGRNVCPAQETAIRARVWELPERPVFLGARDEALTRFGIYKIIRRHTARVVKKGSDGRSKLISPHVWRHTTAVHLLGWCRG